MDAQNKPAVTYRYWRAWPLILCSLMCYVLTGVVSSIVNVASVLFEADRGWDAALLTGGMSVASFINVVTGYIAGRMASRRSAKPVCIAWGVMFIAGVLAMGISTQVGVFVVAMCLANAAASAWGYNTMPVLITRWFPTRKGTVQGFASMGILLGSVSSMVYTWAYRTLGPALSTVPFVVFALVALVLLMALISDWPEQRGFAPDTMERCAPVADPASAELAEDAELAAGAATGAAEAAAEAGAPAATAELEEAGAARHAPAASEIRRFFANPVFVLLTVVLGLQLVFSGGIMVQLVPRLIEVGFTLDQSTLIMTFTSFLACAGSFGAGIIGDRFGAKAGVVLTFILGAVGVVLNLVPNEAVAILGVVCIGCVVGSADNWPVNICAELFDRRMFSQVFGVMFPTIQLVGAIGPALVAQVAQAFGGYQAAYVLLAVLMVVGAVAFPPLMRIVQNRACADNPRRDVKTPQG